ncbi:MAG: hypothetical protein Q8928_08860 [Bacteroidota bacterium]|nr:hypothetical protein [Bacteroidota bacterium]
MKRILTALVFVFGLTMMQAQTVTYEDFKGLIPYLKTEDWKSAFQESSKLLKAADHDTSDFKAIVLYVNIFSAAGMVVNEQMTYKELENNIMQFKGQKIIMSAHPLTIKDGSLNCLKFSVSDTTNEAFTSSTNAKGTNILCFERFHFKDKQNPANFGNSFVRCGGTLDKIELNPNKSMIWILRLTVKNAFARKAG